MPEGRQPHCIWITFQEGLALRELVPPSMDDEHPAYSFAIKLFEALLRLYQDRSLPGINVVTGLMEVVWLNHNVKHDHFPGALDVLAQTWQVMHELAYEQPVRGPGRPFDVSVPIVARGSEIPPGLEGAIA